jgi:tRNA(Ile)-lysidine synthase
MSKLRNPRKPSHKPSQASKPRKAPAAGTSAGRARDAVAKDTIGLEEARRLLSPCLGTARRALLAVSGGPDSVALMRLCALVANGEPRGELQVATVDHGLREGSRAEAEQVGAWARDCGLAHAILTWEGRKPSTRIQALARDARYALLRARMREIGATLLITAHTLDDQAETVLMRMAQGSGLAGLAGMRPSSERDGFVHARPLLAIPKARLIATCLANAWPFIEDPSNADLRFARARWRKLAPALEREGLTAARLAKLARRAASLEEALQSKAEEAFAAACIAGNQESLVLDMVRLARHEPREVALRILLRGLAKMSDAERRVPVRLERVENVVDALYAAFETRKALKRTLAGAILAYDGGERLSLRREGPRRRGGATSAGAARLAAAPHANEGNSIALSALV